jgi:hypothetical protein
LPNLFFFLVKTVLWQYLFKIGIKKVFGCLLWRKIEFKTLPSWKHYLGYVNSSTLIRGKVDVFHTHPTEDHKTLNYHLEAKTGCLLFWKTFKLVFSSSVLNDSRWNDLRWKLKLSALEKVCQFLEMKWMFVTFTYDEWIKLQRISR